VRAGGVPHIAEELSTKATTCFRPHLNWRSDKKLWPSKVQGVPILGIPGFPSWESQDKMTFGCSPHG
jgi:hypothetical protein